MTQPAPQPSEDREIIVQGVVEKEAEKYNDLVSAMEEHKRNHGTVPNVAYKIEAAKGENKTMVIDDKGHLLFKINLETQKIEIVGGVRGGNNGTKNNIYEIDISLLLGLRMRNLISDDPIWIIQADIKTSR